MSWEAVGKVIASNAGDGGGGGDQPDQPSGGGSGWVQSAGLIGGILDTLGVTVTGWVDRAQRKKHLKQQQKNFDRQFEESKRRFGLQFALQEFSTRKGISMQEAQMMYNMATRGIQTGQQVRMGAIQEQAARMDLDERKRRHNAMRAMALGFAQARKKGGRRANTTVSV